MGGIPSLHPAWYNKFVPIKITSRFATARDTARVLGVSKRRTDQLLEMAEEWLAGRAPVSHGRPMRVTRSKRKASRART
jgi:hypothetical protein